MAAVCLVFLLLFIWRTQGTRVDLHRNYDIGAEGTAGEPVDDLDLRAQKPAHLLEHLRSSYGFRERANPAPRSDRIRAVVPCERRVGVALQRLGPGVATRRPLPELNDQRVEELLHQLLLVKW